MFLITLKSEAKFRTVLVFTQKCLQLEKATNCPARFCTKLCRKIEEIFWIWLLIRKPSSLESLGLLFQDVLGSISEDLSKSNVFGITVNSLVIIIVTFGYCKKHFRTRTVISLNFVIYRNLFANSDRQT